MQSLSILTGPFRGYQLQNQNSKSIVFSNDRYPFLIITTRQTGGFLFRAFALLTHSTRSKDINKKTASNFTHCFRLIGLAGFEPAHDGTKNRCLTAWL